MKGFFVQDEKKYTYKYMLLFATNTTEDFVVTLNEKKTIEEPYFLFVFYHVETKEILYKVYHHSEDVSIDRERYNQFSINTTLFNSIGWYRYEVYEQLDDSFDLEGKTMIEEGKMKLTGETFAFTTYNAATTYKTFNG